MDMLLSQILQTYIMDISQIMDIYRFIRTYYGTLTDMLCSRTLQIYHRPSWNHGTFTDILGYRLIHTYYGTLTDINFKT